MDEEVHGEGERGGIRESWRRTDLRSERRSAGGDVEVPAHLDEVIHEGGGALAHAHDRVGGAEQVAISFTDHASQLDDLVRRSVVHALLEHPHGAHPKPTEYVVRLAQTGQLDRFNVLLHRNGRRSRHGAHMTPLEPWHPAVRAAVPRRAEAGDGARRGHGRELQHGATARGRGRPGRQRGARPRAPAQICHRKVEARSDALSSPPITTPLTSLVSPQPRHA